MTNLNKRLDLAEQRAGLGGELAACKCPAGIRVIWDAGNERSKGKPAPGPALCEQCGGERVTLLVVWGDPNEMRGHEAYE